MKLRAEPYTLELRHDMKDSEQDLRRNLNLDWCDAVLFNVVAMENKQLKEYDAILWNEKEKAILFIEYKNTISSYQDLRKRDAQQKKAYAHNIARAFGFSKYNFVITVNGIEPNLEKEKGEADVISIKKLREYMIDPESFESTLIELDYVNRLLNKYDREENIVDLKKEQVIIELKDLRSMIEQVNK
ncbi:Uncharacterised protein [uncultured archaeon]|nr:Uncharacterised protein [uncultured archaeon]